MAFDAFFLSAVLTELREKALGARVEKIHQPSKDAVIFLLRCENGREKLLFAPNPAAPRLYLTKANPENPLEPPMFCMLLRKHLSGARLSDIFQPPMERTATFTFDCTDEMGYPVKKQLVAELMGRTCNLYLLGPEGRIIDCLRRVGLDESSKRQALPGLYYQPPEAITKENPIQMDAGAFERMLHLKGADVLADRLMDTCGGLSPLVCREAALFAAGSTDARIEGCDIASVSAALEEFFQRYLCAPAPYYYAQSDGTVKQFSFCPITQYGSYRRAETFTALLDSFYIVKDRRDAIRQKSQAMRKTVTNLCQRLHRKLAIQEKELLATYDRERLRQFGDIVTANLHRIIKGQTSLLAEDFYDEEMKMVEIPLSPVLSAQQNAAKYYKDYSRMKTAEKELTQQMRLAREERDYLQSVLDELNRAQTEAELEEIRQELHTQGYIRQDTAKRKIKQAKLPPMQFTSTDGYPIFVGRNNRQNDELTFRSARKDDLWLHAQKVHGSHVIIACAGVTPPDDTITQAAQLAAYYSEAVGGQNLPVDMTPVKQVKKPAGGKPGMVIYHTYHTVFVNPYPDIVRDALNMERRDLE